MTKDKLKNIILTFVVGIPAAWGVSYLYKHVNITTSQSLDHRVFWMTDEVPGPGDYATFELSHPLAGPEPVLISKQLKCWPGETLKVEGRDFWCGGHYLGRAKTKTLTGKPLPLFSFSGPIPEGKAFAFEATPTPSIVVTGGLWKLPLPNGLKQSSRGSK